MNYKVLFATALIFASLSICKAAEPLWLTDMDDTALVYRNVPGIDINAATRRLLLEQMDGHKDIVTLVNNERAFRILKSPSVACTGKKVKTDERETFAYLTDLPQLIFPGMRLYMLQSTAQAAGLSSDILADSQQSFANVLARLPLARVGIVGGRNYGESLQVVFEELALRNRLYTRTANDMTAAGMLDMLAIGRIELMVEYPNVVQHYYNALNLTQQLVSVDITEATEYTAGYIMCSKNEQGKQLAQAYSDAIHRASKDERYLQAHLMWFDTSSHQKITALYNKVFNTTF